MDRNTIIGIILIFAIFVGFSVYNNNKANKAYEKQIINADSLYKNGHLEDARTAYMTALRIKPNQPDVILKLNDINMRLAPAAGEVKKDSVNKSTGQKALPPAGGKEPAIKQYGPFSGAATGKNDFITLENDKLELKISLKGGKVYSARLKDYKTFDSKPLVLFDGDSTVFGFNFFTADNKPVQTNDLYFNPVKDQKSYVASRDQQSVVLRLAADSGRYIEYIYSLAPDKYMVDFKVNFVSMGSLVASNQSSITLDWRMYLPQQEKGRQNEEANVAIKYKYFQDEVNTFANSQRKETDKTDITTKLTWIAYKDQFFSSVILNTDFFQNASISATKTIGSAKYLRYYTAEAGIPFNVTSPQPVNLKFYFGPNHFTTLKKEGYELDQLVTLGKNIIRWINRFVIIPIFNWLNEYISNYGLIILILTIIIKIVLFPLTYKSYQAQAKMAVLKPMVDELNVKFSRKEDAMKKQQAQMDLYKRAGVNPMGGCLPMLLQMPILFAMFRFFPGSIELRQQHFLWATDLSTYDSILTLPFAIPIYGNHVSLFTLLMTASTLLTMKMTGSQPGSDQPGMKAMTYMMPVMFMLILNNFSAALTYYYFLANILTYVQNLASKRFINAEAVLAKLEENKKKPVPKSKWQQRLEEAAKQRGLSTPRK
ncbi:MAG TPA: membrane protein insertase YidC [Bacteroidales bacterium]|nr:membrane protein insertase YidC [Bacteroidales bacterium]